MVDQGIIIHWAVPELPAFQTGPITLFAPHLLDELTDIRLACIQGCRPDDIELRDEEGALVPIEFTLTGCRRYTALQKGRTYKLQMQSGSINCLSCGGSRAYIPYRYLGADGHVNFEMLHRLSDRFYSLVWATHEPPSFRASFIQSAGTMSVAVHNQSKWLAQYFNVGGRGAKGSRTEGDTLELRRREGFLVRTLVPKHPGSIMTKEHALVWLDLMMTAIADVVGDLPPIPLSATEESMESNTQTGRALSETSLVANSIRLFLLHFLAFFDFNSADLLELYRCGMTGKIASRGNGNSNL